jgi:Na+-transporting NADH:ubiquinone oxidoreductase subunit NqrE
MSETNNLKLLNLLIFLVIISIICQILEFLWLSYQLDLISQKIDKISEKLGIPITKENTLLWNSTICPCQYTFNIFCYCPKEKASK